MPRHIDPPALRRCVLAVSVLADVDIEPADGGVVLPGPPAVSVPWAHIEETVADHDPEGAVARRRVTELLRLQSLVALLGADAGEHLRAVARLVALPAGHADHLGPGWVQDVLRGGVLELGIGVQGLLGEPDRVTPLPVPVARAAGLDVDSWWPHVRRHAERMGALAAARLGRDGGTDGLLRPVGGCDVLALLVSPSLRRHLAGGDGSGMRAVAVPMRRRGWFDLSTADPAFVGAAWSATDDHDRGLPQPVLVTADEVVLVRRS